MTFDRRIQSRRPDLLRRKLIERIKYPFQTADERKLQDLRRASQDVMQCTKHPERKIIVFDYPGPPTGIVKFELNRSSPSWLHYNICSSGEPEIRNTPDLSLSGEWVIRIPDGFGPVWDCTLRGSYPYVPIEDPTLRALLLPLKEVVPAIYSIQIKRFELVKKYRDIIHHRQVLADRDISEKLEPLRQSIMGELERYDHVNYKFEELVKSIEREIRIHDIEQIKNEVLQSYESISAPSDFTVSKELKDSESVSQQLVDIQNYLDAFQDLSNRTW